VSIGVLGPITFEVTSDTVRTWQDMRRSAAARWHVHEVQEGKPRQEFLGPGLDQLRFSVRLDIARGIVPRDELRQMRKQRDTGAVMQLTIGGELVGDFVLKDLDEGLTHVSRDGVLLVATASLSLEEYVS
jgi:phage protein U